jgi:catechol 2,3-dioxygenase-like lactoylglutathione lyase family enzyme
MDAQVLFAGVAITDLEAARLWYERLFGGPADIVPNENELMWRAAADAGWLYIVVDEPRAGKALAALAVADLNAELAALRSHGIEAELVEQIGDARKATLRDPDGNTIALIEVPS